MAAGFDGLEVQRRQRAICWSGSLAPNRRGAACGGRSSTGLLIEVVETVIGL
jgi:hypothetical protein